MYSISWGTIWLSHRPETESRVWLESMMNLERMNLLSVPRVATTAHPARLPTVFFSGNVHDFAPI
jgi:hypothetical protein